MPQQPAFTRRKLSAIVRKGITSYYTEHEQEEIANAAKKQEISRSMVLPVRGSPQTRQPANPPGRFTFPDGILAPVSGSPSFVHKPGLKSS